MSKFEVFDHENVTYLILKEDPDTLYHFCINDRVNLTDLTGNFVHKHLCSRSIHEYYFHACYWKQWKKPIEFELFCPWCQITVPKELADHFILKPSFFNTICLKCGI